MPMSKTLFAFALVLGLAATAPALAVSSSTARSSGIQAVHTGPGHRYPVIDRLADQERVRLAECTRQARWCRVIQLDGGPSGWVPGSYLIGSPAKVEVTPFEFSFDPLHPGAGLFPRLR